MAIVHQSIGLKKWGGPHSAHLENCGIATRDGTNFRIAFDLVIHEVGRQLVELEPEELQALMLVGEVDRKEISDRLNAALK